ncbi:uncharacterized protein LOC122722071 [Manihot esculenta]|uniref:uncharacterized protein LOC122722071 n=1 Tax=Manihot esculenta TaxID=3983 RepID=UPI001CC74F23|nr:uncharacterized protein LOC122722071 [Manihot esculenta]
MSTGKSKTSGSIRVIAAYSYTRLEWDGITMNFVTGLPLTPRKKDVIWVIVDKLTKSAHFLPIRMDYTLENYQASIKMARYEALYGRKYRIPLCWTEVSKAKLVSPELIRQIEEKVKIIKERLKAATDRQKSYAYLRIKDIEFAVGDKVFLKVSPWKKVLRFGKKGKLSPSFTGPCKIIERVGPVVYKLALHPKLDRIHNVFYVSMLRRYRSDPAHVISVEPIDVQPGLTYEEEPMIILARKMKEVRNKKIPFIKVLWRNHKVEEATWESEEVMKQ